jgi:hypothetical protein
MQMTYGTLFQDDTKNKTKSSIKSPKKADLLRLQNMDKTIEDHKDKIFEFVQLNLCASLIKCFDMKKKTKTKDYTFFIYTLTQMCKSTIFHVNKYITEFVEQILINASSKKENLFEDIFYSVYDVIEKNTYILEYEDKGLYDHQKQLFQLFKSSRDKQLLVMYTAATGTGKTISPIGLSVGNRIIYICAARHVGLALAKSAISMNKAVAFAFGCRTTDDIRLHYYAANEYTKNKKSGAIGKVDNSDGIKVEIMICDVSSYLLAMNYMLVFNEENNIIMYWDEPTISLDKENHELHEIIHKNWIENKISKVVLSCATLPKEHEIQGCLDDFRSKFETATIHSITSIECKKTITILDTTGKCVLPHTLFNDYAVILKSVEHCLKNLSLLRYFDLCELVKFVKHVAPLIPEIYRINNYFDKISDITMNSVKLYYLTILKNIPPEKWGEIFTFMKSTQLPKYATKSMSGILYTTDDAHTLTDGPTIFITEDVHKIGKFYIQQLKIPTTNMDALLSLIDSNTDVQNKIDSLTKSLNDKMGKEIEKEKKMTKEFLNPEAKKIMENIEIARSMLKIATLEHKYIPNTVSHQNVWVKDKTIENAFTTIIEEETVCEIMELDVSTDMKLLLLLGIGVFDITHADIRYMEIMKRLAIDQKLFIIIASSDFIYGTNYQFCHGILGKDLLHMTQQKTIQALGRIGRGNIQQEYTVRFRDDTILSRLFTHSERNLEAENMLRLLKINC